MKTIWIIFVGAVLAVGLYYACPFRGVFERSLITFIGLATYSSLLTLLKK